MPVHHQPLGDSFRPRGPDVILAQHLQHTCTRDPGQHRRRRRSQRDRRQDERPQASGLRDRQPSQRQREQQDEQQTRPEGRHGQPYQGDGHDRGVDRGATGRRGRDAGDDTGAYCQHLGCKCKDQRGRQALGDLLSDGTAATDGTTQVPAHRAPEEFQVLDDDGAIES